MTDPEFSPFEVTFKMRRADHVALCFAMRRRSASRILKHLVLYLLVLTGVALVATAGDVGALRAVVGEVIALRAPWWFYPVIPAGFLLAALLQPLVLGFKAGCSYQRYAIADQEVRLSFEADGLETLLTNFESWVSWHAIEKVIETPDHAFLAISRREALILPRRAFTSEADYRRWLGFVRDRTGTS
jgi:hypothetical protein